MKNTLQINYWTIGGFEGEKAPEQAIEEAAKMGFEGVELTFDGKEFGPGVTETRCKEIKKAAKTLGMKIETLATGAYWGCSLSDPRDNVRKGAVAYTKEYLQAAKWIGAKTVLVVPGAVAIPWDANAKVVPYADAWKLSTQSLRQCLPTAKKLGVTIALENVWNWFLADPIAMRTFVDQFDTARLAVYFDVGNCCINGYPEHWIEVLGRRIKAIHLKNFTREDCGGGLHGFGDDILEGAVDMKNIIRVLQKRKYTGPLTAEMIPFCRLPDLVLPDMDLAQDTATKLRKVMGKK